MTARIEQPIAEIEAFGEVFEWYGPRNEASVAQLERALGAKLPPSYRAFLFRYGGGGTRAYDGISGIYGNDPLSMQLGATYGDTMRMRNDRGVPARLIVIERGDEHFPPMCLDTSCPALDGEFPVVGFWLTSRTVSAVSHATFAEYRAHSLATTLEVIRDEQS